MGVRYQWLSGPTIGRGEAVAPYPIAIRLQVGVIAWSPFLGRLRLALLTTTAQQHLGDRAQLAVDAPFGRELYGETAQA